MHYRFKSSDGASRWRESINALLLTLCVLCGFAICNFHDRDLQTAEVGWRIYLEVVCYRAVFSENVKVYQSGTDI